MSKKGSVIIYVLILIIPVIMILTALTDITVTDYKINSNILIKQQALYYSESGMEFAYNTLKKLGYPKSLNSTYYIKIYDNRIEISDKKTESNKMIVVNIISEFRNNKVIYIINSTGIYKGYVYNIKKIIE